MISPTLLTLLTTATLATLTTATISYNSTLTHAGSKEPWFDGSIPPTSISASCASAYAQDLPCDEWLIKGFDNGSSEDEKFTNATLKALCTDTCLLGLQKWRDDVRKSCTDKDVGARKSTVGQQTISSLLDAKQMFVQYLYWPTCMKDLNKGTLCYADDTNLDSPASSNDSENTPAIIDAFCKNNCETQASVFTWVVGESMYNDTKEINIADARKVCKGLDTSKYPFLKDLSAAGSSSSSASSSGSAAGAGTNSTGGNGTGAGAKNDGVRVGVGLLPSVALAAAAVVLGLGTF